MTTTIILGTGIIGVSTAYYLARHQPPSTIHLVEPSPQLFACASGLAGGFLAKDWFSPAASALGALSFEEHRRLAEREGGRERWGYSGSTAFSYSSEPPRQGSKRGEDWLRTGTSRAGVAADIDNKQPVPTPRWLIVGDGIHVETIGDPGNTAQIDPLRLCEFLLDKCLHMGVHLHHPAKALSVSTDNRNELASVCIGHTDSSTETDIPCTRVVITAGPWSTRVFEELFGPSATPPRITSLAGYSLVVKTPNWSEEDEKACFAVFSSGNQGFSPELISRMGGEIYIAGLNSSALPLPNLPTDRQVKTEEIERLKSAAKDIIRVASGSSEFEIIRQEVCFRPVTETGSPMLGRIPDSHLGESITTRPGAEGGVYLAAGHGPWGISLSLGTGKVMAELMQGQDPSAEISQLSP